MELGIGFIAGFILSGLWTAWIMQRCINRQSVFPSFRTSKAKVITPTSLDRELKNKENLNQSRLKRIKENTNWLKPGDLPTPFMKIGKK